MGAVCVTPYPSKSILFRAKLRTLVCNTPQVFVEAKQASTLHLAWPPFFYSNFLFGISKAYACSLHSLI